ncbi:hypothetical protein F3Y22_tig00111342pilonHSYRG00093 [Hibiscus syriacus]|uniref:Malic enzyme NAD-binding domain-containing protein n=1 Tax=Hibiscus syriacus TaxID=106335 RepID=A0A6A2YP04_HIBSY|nr:hypothetical protein F3Y22_tig00111342pilonHSYRG00093 [Hibiscus syriacus]
MPPALSSVELSPTIRSCSSVLARPELVSRQNGKPIEENRKKIWLVDSKGLIVASRKESLQDFKKPWAHDHEPVTELINTVEAIKPTILIGTSGVVKQFTKEVVEAMASLNKTALYYGAIEPDIASRVHDRKSIYMESTKRE